MVSLSRMRQIVTQLSGPIHLLARRSLADCESAASDHPLPSASVSGNHSNHKGKSTVPLAFKSRLALPIGIKSSRDISRSHFAAKCEREMSHVGISMEKARRDLHASHASALRRLDGLPKSKGTGHVLNVRFMLSTPLYPRTASRMSLRWPRGSTFIVTSLAIDSLNRERFSSDGASPSAVVRQTISGYKFVAVRARLGDSAGSIPATCIAGYLFATDKVHVKQTDLCARANNVSYEALDDECCSISGCYPVPRPLTLNLTLKMTLNIKTKVIFVFSVPNLTLKRVLREI